MKYYRLLPNLEYKGCYVENENTLNLIKPELFIVV